MVDLFEFNKKLMSDSKSSPSRRGSYAANGNELGDYEDENDGYEFSVWYPESKALRTTYSCCVYNGNTESE